MIELLSVIVSYIPNTKKMKNVSSDSRMGGGTEVRWGRLTRDSQIFEFLIRFTVFHGVVFSNLQTDTN